MDLYVNIFLSISLIEACLEHTAYPVYGSVFILFYLY